MLPFNSGVSELENIFREDSKCRRISEEDEAGIF
jgi:hypothetical protein